MRNGLQYAATALFFAAVAWVLWRAGGAMREQDVMGNFSVLFEETRWNISASLLDHSADTVYWRTLAIAVFNTLAVGIPAILIATVLGVLVGVARVAPNKALSSFTRLYVEIFRNVPVILQVVFWYGVLLNGPRVADAITIGSGVVITNRGISVAAPELSLIMALTVFACLVAGILLFAVSKRAATPGPLRMTGALCLMAGFVAVVVADYDLPTRQGLQYSGGLSIPLEYVALLLGLVLYAAAYIAEIVRGGLNSVPKGQIEAAAAIGLSPVATFFLVRVPLALRVMVPSLSNQYLFVMKGTGLGIAIGFAEIFQVTVTSINQSGKSIDFLVIMMLLYGLINFTIARAMSFANARLALKARADG